MAKRKPPSQRPNRQLDDTARAIAAALDQERPTKPAETKRLASAGPQPATGRGGKNQGHVSAGGPVPTASSKRPKQP